jgi:hypothetical protein
MMSAYRAFDEGWLDKALAAAESSEEQTPPSDEDIILQVRQTPGHVKSTSNDESRPVQSPSTEGPAARTEASHAVTQLRGIAARTAKRLQAIREYLEWLPADDVPDDDHARPEPHADENAGGAGKTRWRTPLDQPEPMSAEDLMTAEAAVRKGEANDRSVLDDLHARLAELMEEVKYLHGASTPGAPWLLLCRNSDVAKLI